MPDAPIPVLNYDDAGDRERVEHFVSALTLDPRTLFRDDEATAAVRATLADVAERGDEALVDAARKFDDPAFTADQLRVEADELAEAAGRIGADLRDSLKRSIDQVREYQQYLMPPPADDLRRGGLRMGLRYTPLASAGCYVPGGKASYPSSLIHLAVPAQAAGVKQVVAVTPPSSYGRSDLVLAAAHELGLPYLIRAGGAAAIGALAFGTETVPRVDKIVGPGNRYVQIAKRLVAGGVGVDGFLGPSEVLVFADETTNAAFAAADLLAQAEHDPGSCFLLTTSRDVADRVVAELVRQSATLKRSDAIAKALRDHSAIIVAADVETLVRIANRIAPEHLSVQTRDPRATLAKLANAGCAFLGPYSPVAAGDYVAGPSHCLPTNTTARFAGGISVFEFLKRGGVVEYDEGSLRADAPHVERLAAAEHLDAHAASVSVRVGP